MQANTVRFQLVIIRYKQKRTTTKLPMHHSVPIPLPLKNKQACIIIY